METVTNPAPPYSAAPRHRFEPPSTLDAEFTRNLREILDRHFVLEQSREQTALQDYALPTADAFAYVFGLMAKVPAMKSHFRLLTTVGRFVGTALLAFDCAVDWRRDQRTGAMNPLASEDDVNDAWDLTQSAIQQAINTCERELGANAKSAHVLRGVEDRILAHQQHHDVCNDVSALALLGNRKKHVYLYSGCEVAVGCCCCLMCCGAVAKSCDGDSKTVHVYHHRGCQ